MAGFLAVALFLAAGLGLTELVPALARLRWGPRLAYAYLLGIAWVAGLLYGLSHFAGVPLRRPAVLVVAAVPVVLGGLACFLRRPRRRARRRPRWTRLEWLALGLGATMSLAVFAEAVTNPLRDWDGRMTWATSARYIRAEATVEARVFREPGWYMTHEWYPLLLPVAQVVSIELVEADKDRHVFRPLYAAFFPVLLVLIHRAGRRFAGRAGGALTATAAAVLPFVVYFPGGGAVSGYSDIPLACFYGAALLLLAGSRPRLGHGLAAGLLLAACTLTKNEGLPLALWLLVVAGAIRPRAFRRRWRALAAAAAVVAPAAVLLVSWRAGIPGRFASYEQLISWANLWPGVVERVPFLLARVSQEMAAREDWGFLWWAALLVLAAGWRGVRRRSALLMALAAAGPLGFAWLGYTVSHDPGYLIQTSWNRFLLQAFVPLLALLAMAAEDIVQRTRRPGRGGSGR